MLLRELIGLYRLERDLKESSIDQLHYTVSLFGRFLVQPASTDDLTDDVINRFVEWLAVTPTKHGKVRSKRTTKGNRDNLVTLWNYAWETERIDRQPRRVKRVRVQQTLPVAWNESQMAQWLAGCDKCAGFFATCSAPARIVMRAWSLISWDTAARVCDLLLLKRSEISAEGAVVITQEKTGYPVLCRLRPETMAALDELVALSGLDQLFPFCRATLDHHWRKVAELSGIAGTPKAIRKARATSAEIRERGSAPSVLGHVPGSSVAWGVPRSLRPGVLAVARPLFYWVVVAASCRSACSSAN